MQMQTLGFRVGQLMAACYRRGLMARSVIRERPALAPHLGACRQLALPPHSGTTRSISTSQVLWQLVHPRAIRRLPNVCGPRPVVARTTAACRWVCWWPLRRVSGGQPHGQGLVDVKFGAIHVVDLGRELEHAPAADPEPSTPFVYVVGHGASQNSSPESWMQGSDVYMARVAPSADAVNDRSAWEFYAGHGEWSRNGVSAAQSLISWGNRTGVTTITYVPAVKRFIMCVSTPTWSPFTTREFDTYLLESEHIHGPFRYITYMRAFGPQAYFVNIPSKFVSASLDPGDGSLKLMLSYSANFAMPGSHPNPPGSGYGWVLQEVKLHTRTVAEWV
mmetsp:Transcript_88696/g.286580  ORF Transcript_88696/g.286580 Transcript_88696/m.286580 type:complete len:333 (-) Transcript_88696:248-1246(-)